MMFVMHLCPRCGAPILNPTQPMHQTCIAEIHANPDVPRNALPTFTLRVADPARGLLSRFKEYVA